MLEKCQSCENKSTNYRRDERPSLCWTRPTLGSPLRLHAIQRRWTRPTPRNAAKVAEIDAVAFAENRLRKNADLAATRTAGPAGRRFDPPLGRGGLTFFPKTTDKRAAGLSGSRQSYRVEEKNRPSYHTIRHNPTKAYIQTPHFPYIPHSPAYLTNDERAGHADCSDYPAYRRASAVRIVSNMQAAMPRADRADCADCAA